MRYSFSKVFLIKTFLFPLLFEKYNLFDRQMIRFIMWLTKGPTDTKSVIEFTNWDDVKQFAYLICKL